MIPKRKKTTEEISALREGLGIPATEHAPERPVDPAPATPAEGTIMESPAHIASQTDIDEEPVIHLEPMPVSAHPQYTEIKPSHSLRKHDLPLAPAPPVTHRTELPAHRHDTRDISQIRKREALAALQQPATDPVAHIRKRMASPFLYVPGYLLAIAASISVYQRFHFITPVALIGLAILVMLYIALRKPHSRHHAALLFILVFLTLVFGALHYAPLFQNGP